MSVCMWVWAHDNCKLNCLIEPIKIVKYILASFNSVCRVWLKLWYVYFWYTSSHSQSLNCDRFSLVDLLISLLSHQVIEKKNFLIQVQIFYFFCDSHGGNQIFLRFALKVERLFAIHLFCRLVFFFHLRKSFPRCYCCCLFFCFQSCVLFELFVQFLEIYVHNRTQTFAYSHTYTHSYCCIQYGVMYAKFESIMTAKWDRCNENLNKSTR